MNRIRTQMARDDRCPDCGALLNDQPTCGHCGWEMESTVDLAAIIPLPLPEPVTADWQEEPQVA